MNEALVVANLDPVDDLLAKLFDSRVVLCVAFIVRDDVIEVEYRLCLLCDLWVFAQVCIVVHWVAVKSQTVSGVIDIPEVNVLVNQHRQRPIHRQIIIQLSPEHLTCQLCFFQHQNPKSRLKHLKVSFVFNAQRPHTIVIIGV